MGVNDIARYLAATGFAKLEGEKAYVLTVEDSVLSETLWEGDRSLNETPIAEDVKEDSSAAYCIADGIRLVIFVDNNDALQCYKLEGEGDSWDDTGLAETWNVTVGKKSKVAASFGLNGEVNLFYQTAGGEIKGMVSTPEGKWKSVGPLKADAAQGTPLTLVVLDEELHLFYVGKDGNVHFQIRNDGTGAWQDHILQGAHFKEHVQNLSAAKDPKGAGYIGHFLVGGNLVDLDAGGNQTTIGKVAKDGNLTLKDNAQCGMIIIVPYYYMPRRRPYCCW